MNPQDCSEDEEIALKTLRYKCGSCGRSYSSKNQMLKHQNSAHADSPYSCDICGHRFVSKQKISFHIRTHQDCNRSEHFMAVKKLYKCGVCKHLISTKSALERHKSNIHFDIYDFMCEVCSARFRDRSSLNKHLVKHHKKVVDTSSDFVCLQCGMRFITFSRFERHEAACQKKPEQFETAEDKAKMSNTWESEIKDEYEAIVSVDDKQEHQSIKQEVTPREVIQCKLCPLILETTEEFKNHFVAKHVRLQNVSFSTAKKLNKPLIIKSVDYGTAMQSHEHFVKQEPANPEDCEFGVYDNLEALENDIEKKLEDVEEYELLLMMQGETFNIETSNFECRICSTTFKDLELLQSHCMRVHRVSKIDNVKDSLVFGDMSVPSKNFTCEFCGKELSTKMSLKRHIQFVHNSDRTEIYCDQCAESFKDIRALKKHIAKGHTDILDISKPSIIRRRKTTKRMTCDDCGEEVFGQLGLAQHWWNVHKSIKIVDKTRYHCLICRQVMLTRATAMRHHTQVHEDGQRLFRSCRVCEMEFQLYSELKSHIDLYHAGGHICLVCGFGFDTSLDLFNHSKLHRAVPDYEKKLSCDLCGFRAQQKVSIETHMTNSHGATKKAYAGNTCEYCGVFFKCYQSFYTHIKNSHSKSPKDLNKYSCGFCNQKYKYSRDLRNHELLHLDPDGE